MHIRRQRVRIETDRHAIEGTLQMPSEGYRSRMTDFLNAHEQDFVAVTDARIEWLDGTRRAEELAYVAVSTRHVVLVTELESLGVFDETGAPPSESLAAVSSPPPST
jgi:hypothetical protein